MKILGGNMTVLLSPFLSYILSSLTENDDATGRKLVDYHLSIVKAELMSQKEKDNALLEEKNSIRIKRVDYSFD
jgi:hypothetical protein